MEFSFSITDLKKSVPGAAALSALEGDALLAMVLVEMGRTADALRDTGFPISRRAAVFVLRSARSAD